MILDEKEQWLRLFAAIVGARPEQSIEHCADLADKAMREFRSRHDVLGKWERERDRLLERVHVMDRQREVGVMALLSAKRVCDDVKERAEHRTEPVRWTDLDRLLHDYDLHKLAKHTLVLCGNTYTIVPIGMKPPEAGETGEDNPILWSPERFR